MILSEKIMSLRKQNGWSQENLADQLDVSRQSVSKWESGTSIPDIEKIVKMSELFNVSTDYLLKETDDEADVRKFANTEEGYVELSEEKKGREISVEFATEYLSLVAGIAKRFALAVAICVASPILLIILSGMAEDPYFNISENLAAGIGVPVLLVMIAVATMVFIFDGMKLSKYDFLEKENITLKYGVEAIVGREKQAYEKVYTMAIVIGVGLCIISVIPVVVAGALEASDFICIVCTGILLFMISSAVYLFVSSGMVYSSYKKLLQEDEFSVEEKEEKEEEDGDAVSTWYWCVATAVYLIWSFATNDWDITWMVWMIAGVLYAPFKIMVQAICKNKKQ